MKLYMVVAPFNGAVTTVFSNGNCIFSGLSFEDYVSKNNLDRKKIHLVSLEALQNKFLNPYLNSLQGKWEEISEERYYYLLECISPLGYKTENNFTLFFVGEAYYLSIHRCCVCHNGKYYTALMDTKLPMQSVIDDLLKFIKHKEQCTLKPSL